MSTEEMNDELLRCPQCELSVLGTFFKTPLLFFSYVDVVKNMDFSDGNTRFWHVFLNDYLLTYSNEVSPALLNTFATMESTRFQSYKRFGGWKEVQDMMSLALDEDGLIKAVKTLKKYSLLRGLANDGFHVENILGKNNFSTMDAEDVASFVQGKLDTTCNDTIVNLNKPTDMVKDAGSFVDSFFVAPSQGLDTPFNFFNELCLGLLGGDSLFYGSLTNSGKGRSLIYIACYLAMVEGAKVSILENEMDLQRMRQAFITTALNADYAQKLTGCKLAIPEKRLVLASYLDNATGLPMYRHYDKEGNQIETEEQFRERVAKNSDEYQMVKTVMEYLEKNVNNKIYFKNITNNYGDTSLVRYFNQEILVNGTNVVIYDTIKNAPSNSSTGSDIGSWAQLVNTATILQETVAKLKTAAAIMSFQLDRSAYKKRIEELSEDNIAGASGIMHIADQMCMFLHLKQQDYKDYKISQKVSEWGDTEKIGVELNPNKQYTGFRIMKNRRGSKGSIFVTETDLNLNTWKEIPGELIVEKPRAMGRV